MRAEARLPSLLALALWLFVPILEAQEPPRVETNSEDARVRAHPGFVDFAALGLFSEDDLEMHVSVKGPMLQLVAASSRESDPDLSDMLGGLLAVEVLVYEIGDGTREDLAGSLKRLAKDLEREDWATAVTLRTQEAYGFVLMQLRDGAPQGLAAMYVEKTGNAILVNIVGRIDPAQIGRLAQRFNIDFLAEGAFQPPPQPADEQP